MEDIILNRFAVAMKHDEMFYKNYVLLCTMQCFYFCKPRQICYLRGWRGFYLSVNTVSFIDDRLQMFFLSIASTEIATKLNEKLTRETTLE